MAKQAVTPDSTVREYVDAILKDYPSIVLLTTALFIGGFFMFIGSFFIPCYAAYQLLFKVKYEGWNMRLWEEYFAWACALTVLGVTFGASFS